MNGGMRLAPRQPTHALIDELFRAAGFLLVAGSLALPWVQSRSLGKGSALTVSDLSLVRWVFMALLVALLASSVAQIMGRRSVLLPIADAIIAALLALVPIFLVGLLDVLSIWIYPSFLPTTLRRLIIGVTPEAGVWLAILGAGVIILSVLEESSHAVDVFRHLVTRVVRRDLTALAIPLLVVGIPLAMEARYRPWLELNSRVGHWSLPGFAIPVVGVATLLIVVVVVAVGIFGVVRPTALSGVVLVISGWLLTIPSAVLLVITVPRVHVELPSIVRDHLSQWSTDVHLASRGRIVIPPVPSGHLALQVTAGSGLNRCYLAGAIIAIAGVLTYRASTRGLP